jgi:threonine aldolase
MVPPHGGVICHREAHIETDEGGAPGFYTHGAKLILAEGEGAKLIPAAIDAVMADPQGRPPGPAAGRFRHPGQRIRALLPAGRDGRRCRRREAHGLALHVDGARFANAVAWLECTPWQACARVRRPCRLAASRTAG